MKKFLLTFIAVLATVASADAQEWEWGTATWNIEDGRVYEDINDFNTPGVVLSYPNPTDYYLTFLNVIAVNYNVFVDEATEPVEYTSSAQMGADVKLSYHFLEGHSYKVVTTGAVLVQANLATYSTDTLSQNADSYTISFSIKGPELVKTLDVEGTLSLAVIDQNAEPAYSVVDTKAIVKALGINSLDEATIYALAADGAYVPREQHAGLYDGWRDADGEYTTYWGGWDSYHGHNAYPAVYCIKLNETSDTISYFFYDYWSEYNPEQADTVGGSGLNQAVKQRVPETSYNNIVWEWYDEEGDSIIYYNRRYRVDEGSDYKGGFIYIANKKAVVVNATLHFVSQEDYAGYLTAIEAPASTEPEEAEEVVAIYNLSGTRIPDLQKGFNLVKYSTGQVKKVFLK